MKMKKVVALILALCMVAALAACGKKEEAPKSRIDEIKKAGKLVVGTSADYPPYEGHIEIDGVDTIAGFDIDIAQHWADSLGVELEIVDMAFDNLLISLSQGQMDAVIAGLTSDEERLKSVDFTDVYLENQSLVLIRTADVDKYKTSGDVMGAKAAAQNGAKTMDRAIEYAGEANVIGLTKVPDMVMELKSGKVDVVFLDYMVALAYDANNDDLSAVDLGIPVTEAGYQAAVQKGDAELVAFLNEDIKKMLDEDLVTKYVVAAQELFGIEE